MNTITNIVESNSTPQTKDILLYQGDLWHHYHHHHCSCARCTSETHVLPNVTKNIAVSAGLSDRIEVRGMITLIENLNDGKYFSRAHHNFKYSSRSADACLKKHENHSSTNANNPKFIVFSSTRF